MNFTHDFVSVSLMPIDARVASDGEIEYANAPDRQQDLSPEFMCRICYKPLTPEAIDETCSGAGVPDDISGITDTRPEEG